ncbi:MAG: hypothetical protein ACTSRA_16420, partial [Promethearchaeota archaeon]
LDEVLEEVAIPKLVDALRSDDDEMRKNVATRLVELSKKKPAMIKAVLKFVQEAQASEKRSDIKKLIDTIVKNYERNEKRKLYNQKRKKMQELDNKLLSGKITSEEYIKERKEFLKLSGEFEE